MTCRCKKQFCYVCGGDYPNCLCKTGKGGQANIYVPPSSAPASGLRSRKKKK